MRVLIVDDIEDSVKGIIDSCDECGWENQLSGFDDAYSKIIDFNPDVIVLDWREDADSVDTGATILDKIWDIMFRPVILFTANAEIIDVTAKRRQSSMLKVISKGDEEPVIAFLKQIEKFVSALSEYRKNMSTALIASLNSIDYLKDIENIDEPAVEYILSKRTSSFFDDQFISEISPSWVQYICPPLSNCLNVCDIIRVKNAETEMDALGNPQEYCLILTPSCDMFFSPGRDPKVAHVLCAHCFPKESFHQKPLSNAPSNTQIDGVKRLLNTGYNEKMVALPGFANKIPYMSVDLKKLELIPLEKIAVSQAKITENTEYYRIASVCSPFREQIVWAHLQNSCRPGVPDRNTELWAREILKA